MRIASSRSDATLEFANVRGDQFRVSVTAKDHSAALDVSAHTDAHGVERLLSEAARDWQGWSGAKVWESLEGECRLEMSHDRKGHVTLRVRLHRSFGGPDPWCVDTEISLEAGQLDAIAAEAHRLWEQAG